MGGEPKYLGIGVKTKVLVYVDQALLLFLLVNIISKENK